MLQAHTHTLIARSPFKDWCPSASLQAQLQADYCWVPYSSGMTDFLARSRFDQLNVLQPDDGFHLSVLRCLWHDAKQVTGVTLMSTFPSYVKWFNNVWLGYIKYFKYYRWVDWENRATTVLWTCVSWILFVNEFVSVSLVTVLDSVWAAVSWRQTVINNQVRGRGYWSALEAAVANFLASERDRDTHSYARTHTDTHTHARRHNCWLWEVLE